MIWDCACVTVTPRELGGWDLVGPASACGSPAEPGLAKVGNHSGRSFGAPSTI